MWADFVRHRSYSVPADHVVDRHGFEVRAFEPVMCKGCVPHYEPVPQEGSLKAHAHAASAGYSIRLVTKQQSRACLLLQALLLALLSAHQTCCLDVRQSMEDVSHDHDHMQSDALKSCSMMQGWDNVVSRIVPAVPQWQCEVQGHQPRKLQLHHLWEAQSLLEPQFHCMLRHTAGRPR